MRDPLPTYTGDFTDNINDNEEVAHYQNLLSSNWNSMRFKSPPDVHSDIGWRVEFRTLDIQLTDFENAAFIVLLAMIRNVINYFDVNFIIPISQIDRNMDIAGRRDAVVSQKFSFRTNVVPKTGDYTQNCLRDAEFLKSRVDTNSNAANNPNHLLNPEQIEEEEKFEELTIREVLEGKEEVGYIGLYPLIYKFIELQNYSEEQKKKLKTFLDYMLDKAKGEVPTGARFMREFVHKHPAYQQDSKLNKDILYDLMYTLLHLNTDQEIKTAYLGEKYNMF